MLELICKKTCGTCQKAVALLDAKKIPYRCREYTREPLSEQEIRSVLAALKLGPKDVLRTKDAAYERAGITGKESDDQLIALMVEHPTLLQRPIGVLGKRAAVGRPPENLLALVDA